MTASRRVREGGKHCEGLEVPAKSLRVHLCAARAGRASFELSVHVSQAHGNELNQMSIFVWSLDMDSKEIRIFIPRDTTAVASELELACNTAFCAESHLRNTAFQLPMRECQGMSLFSMQR